MEKKDDHILGYFKTEEKMSKIKNVMDSFGETYIVEALWSLTKKVIAFQ